MRSSRERGDCKDENKKTNNKSNNQIVLKIEMHVLRYQRAIVSAYALIMTTNFFAYNDGAGEAIIAEKYGQNFRAIVIEIWKPYYQELTRVIFLVLFL